MLILCLIVFVGLTGVGIIIPLFPFFGENVGASPSTITLLMSIFAAGQFLAAPLWGKLSDKVGRKPIFLFTLAGSAFSYLLLGYAESITELLFSRLVAGLMAGNIPVAFAAASDLTVTSERSKAMGKVGAAFSLGFIFGPTIGGFVAGPSPESTNFFLIAFLAGSLSLLSFFLTLFFFKETKDMNGVNDSQEIEKLGFLKEIWKYLGLPIIGLLILINFLFIASGAILDSTFALWANKEHGFGPQQIAYLFTYMGIIMALLQGFAIGPLSKRFGDHNIVIFSPISYVIGLIIFILSNNLFMIVVGSTFLTAGISLFIPASSSMISIYAPDKDQGAILGIFQAAGNLGRVLTPTFSGLVFVAYGPTAPFYISIIILIPTILVALYVGRNLNAINLNKS
ncbi:MAG: MFS transporter [Pseudomonadota bacterium]|nr:MFS transporter [Pseudomonadota bacterium]